MIELCRHIFLDGRFCRGAAVKGTFFCRHHDSVRKTLTQPRRSAPGCLHQLLPFAYPEDRKAILLNLFLVQNALNEGGMDPRRANALTNIMRAQMSNLTKTEKAEAQQTNLQTGRASRGSREQVFVHGVKSRRAAQVAIHQIYETTLTPEGEEIAAAPQPSLSLPKGLEEMWENQLAEETNNQSQPSPNECHPERSEGPAFSPSATSASSKPESSPNGCHPERTGVPDARDLRVTGWGSEGPAVYQPATNAGAPHLEEMWEGREIIEDRNADTAAVGRR